jgi:hypothetical protein
MFKFFENLNNTRSDSPFLLVQSYLYKYRMYSRELTYRYLYTGMEAYGRKRRGLVAENGVESVRLPAKIFLKDMY